MAEIFDEVSNDKLKVVNNDELINSDHSKKWATDDLANIAESDKICTHYIKIICKLYKNLERGRFQHPKIYLIWMRTGGFKNPTKCKVFYYPK